VRHAVHQSLVREPVGDELGDGDECEAVLRGEPSRSGRRAIVPSGLRISQITPAG